MIKRTVTILFRIVLAFSLLFVLAGCAALRPREALVLWHSLDGVREQALLKLIDQWNQSNPDGIFITPERRSSAAQHDAVLNGAATKALPALILAEPVQAAVYERSGILAPLEAYANNSDAATGWGEADRADFYPFVLQAGKTPQGKLIGMPFGGDVRALFLNRDWLQTLQADLPESWTGFSELCAAATDRFQGTICFAVDPDDLLFEEWVSAHGGQAVASDSGQLQIASPASVQAIDELLQYAQNGQAYRAASRQRSRDDFAAARVLFAFDWGSQLHAYDPVIRERGNFSWDVSTMPMPSSNERPAALFRAPLWVIPKSTPERMQAAWKFVHWLFDEPQVAQWARETGELPARVSTITQIGAEPIFASVVQRIAPYARAAPLYGGWPCVQEELAGAMRQVLDNQPITDTLQLAQARAEQVLNADCSMR